MAIGAVGFDFFQLGAAVPDLTHDYGALHLDPGVRTAQWMLEAFDVRVPGAEVEVKIVLAVMLGGVRRLCCELRCWRGLHDRRSDLQQAAERAEREVTSDTPEQFHFLLLILHDRATDVARHGVRCELRAGPIAD
jgi:hypothetical protein